MRQCACGFAIAFLLTLPGWSSAQVIQVLDTDSRRLSLAAGYGGHGVDLQAAVESRLLWDRVRLRASLGHGRWDEQFTPLGLAAPLPRVTRLGFSVIRFSQSDRQVAVRGYAGAGFTVLALHGDRRALNGIHGLLGIEANGDHWSFGPEFVVELPAYDRTWPSPAERPLVRLAPAARIAFSLKRRF